MRTATFSRRHAARPCRRRTAPGYRRAAAATTRPMRCTVSPRLARAARRRLGVVGASTTAIMPMPQLKVRAISASATPPARCEPARRPAAAARRAASISAAQALGQHARHVLDQAAAGDVGQRLDARRCGAAARQLLDIDPRRRQQRLAERFGPASNGAGAVIAQPARLDDPAHQRVAVGMQRRSRRGRG